MFGMISRGMLLVLMHQRRNCCAGRRAMRWSACQASRSAWVHWSMVLPRPASRPRNSAVLMICLRAAPVRWVTDWLTCGDISEFAQDVPSDELVDGRLGPAEHVVAGDLSGVVTARSRTGWRMRGIPCREWRCRRSRRSAAARWPIPRGFRFCGQARRRNGRAACRGRR